MSEQGLHLVCRSLLCRPIKTDNDNNNNNNNIVRTFKQKKDSVAHALLYSTVQYSTVQYMLIKDNLFAIEKFISLWCWCWCGCVWYLLEP